MSDKRVDPSVAQRVELAVSQLDCLSTLPCILTQFLSQLSQFQLSPSSLSNLIESDPALSSQMLSLMHKQGLKVASEDFSIQQLLEKLPLRVIRDAILSVKVLAGFGEDAQRLELRKELQKHSLATACCAEGIAQLALTDASPGLCYLAGLLHNIGNYALSEAMPRSFATIIEQAKAENVSICRIQQEKLGTDYTILGKKLAQKWRFPQQLILAIWLHQSDTETICQAMPQAKIASIVQLACLTARQCNIGQSGSCDLIEDIDGLARSLGISADQLQQIQEQLPEKVAQRCKVLGLDTPKAQAAYCETIHTTAAELSKDNTNLSSDNLKL